MTRLNSVIVRDLAVDHATTHGSVRALAPTSLVVEGGTSVAVMGPSGCGKSTLLGIIAGLASPTQGTVTIGEHTISSLSERDRVRFRRSALGMIYQADNLLPYLTVEENVGLPVAIRRDGSSSGPVGASPHADGDPTDVLARLGLGDLARRLPDQLSGGQRQRVAVARAVIHRPLVILADEPTGSLDAASAQLVIEVLMDAHREIGATLVLVTHDPGIAARLSRTVHLEELTVDVG